MENAESMVFVNATDFRMNEMDKKTLEAIKTGRSSVSSVASVWFGMEPREVEHSFRRLRDAGLIVYAGGCSWRAAQ